MAGDAIGPGEGREDVLAQASDDRGVFAEECLRRGQNSGRAASSDRLGCFVSGLHCTRLGGSPPKELLDPPIETKA